MKSFAAMLLGLLILAAPAAFADEPLSATLEARKVLRTADGREHFESADQAQPNDVLEYQVVYANRSQKTLRGVAATLPVPEGFEYVANTAGLNALASLDGKTYAPVPLTRMVRLRNGAELRPVPLSEYRFLRWNLGDMPAGTSRTLTARMRMNSVAAAVAAAQ